MQPQGLLVIDYIKEEWHGQFDADAIDQVCRSGGSLCDTLTSCAVVVACTFDTLTRCAVVVDYITHFLVP